MDVLKNNRSVDFDKNTQNERFPFVLYWKGCTFTIELMNMILKIIFFTGII